jgi:hypothetical protein
MNALARQPWRLSPIEAGAEPQADGSMKNGRRDYVRAARQPAARRPVAVDHDCRALRLNSKRHPKNPILFLD